MSVMLIGNCRSISASFIGVLWDDSFFETPKEAKTTRFKKRGISGTTTE
jgi:hypothetical protein